MILHKEKEKGDSEEQSWETAERAVRDPEAKTAAIGQKATGEMVSHFSNEIKYKIRPKLG